jgi:hypothetical protein
LHIDPKVPTSFGEAGYLEWGDYNLRQDARPSELCLFFWRMN